MRIKKATLRALAGFALRDGLSRYTALRGLRVRGAELEACDARMLARVECEKEEGEKPPEASRVYRLPWGLPPARSWSPRERLGTKNDVRLSLRAGRRRLSIENAEGERVEARTVADATWPDSDGVWPKGEPGFEVKLSARRLRQIAELFLSLDPGFSDEAALVLEFRKGERKVEPVVIRGPGAEVMLMPTRLGRD